MKKNLLIILSIFTFSCSQDVLHETLELYDFNLRVDSFVSVYEEAARIKETDVPIRITLVGHQNGYKKSYTINMGDELTIKGLVDMEYTIFANALYDGTLYYKEVTFNPVNISSQAIVLEGVVTKFKVTPLSWPEECGKIQINLNYKWVTMIDETGYVLNELFTGAGVHEYSLLKDEEPQYVYATPFGLWSFEITLYNASGEVMISKNVEMEKEFERLKSYDIKIDLSGMADQSTTVSFLLDNLVFEDEEVIL